MKPPTADTLAAAENLYASLGRGSTADTDTIAAALANEAERVGVAWEKSINGVATLAHERWVEIERLRAAIEPFVSFLQFVEAGREPKPVMDYEILFYIGRFDGPRAAITVDQWRALTAALAARKPT